MTIHSDGESRQTKPERVSKLSAKDKEVVFNNVGHIIDIPLLKEMFHRLSGRKAIGIDGVTKASYGQRLDENLYELLTQASIASIICIFEPLEMVLKLISFVSHWSVSIFMPSQERNRCLSM